MGSTTGGINDLGEIAGWYWEGVAEEFPSGFLWNGSTFQNIPGTLGTHVSGINNSGQIVGNNFVGGPGNPGFLDSGGHFTSLNGSVIGINNAGEILGFLPVNINGTHEFLYNNGTYTTFTLDDPPQQPIRLSRPTMAPFPLPSTISARLSDTITTP
jgi:hypothetical protein